LSRIRKARISDVPQLQKLINTHADQGEMLHRSLNDLYENIRDYFVMENGDEEILGCCSLHIAWEDLAEVKSLVVRQDQQGKGVGKALMQACLDEASELGIARVFALTYVPGFFAKMGFSPIDKGELPHKIWSECIHCPKFPDCGEEAVMWKQG
jgi:amino-acid N-acetyltransferase